MRQMSIAGVLFGMAFAGVAITIGYRRKRSKRGRPRRGRVR